MALEVSKDILDKIVLHCIKLSNNENGDFVVLNKIDEEADEFLISSLKDFALLKPKDGDFFEFTVYDSDDEDIFYEEFILGNGVDDKKSLIKYLGLSDNSESLDENKKNEKEKNKDNHFQKFFKKK